MMDAVAVSAGGVERRFNVGTPDELLALGPLDLDIARGEFVCIVGPSGCGKSTFLRIVAGLVRPTEGQIAVRLTGESPTPLSMVFQDYGIYPWKTVEANVRFGLEVRGTPKRQARERARHWIFEEAGIGLDDLKVEQIPSPDMVTALENGAVDSAWLLDPYWIQAAENDELMLVATQPPGEPIGGLYFGEHMFGEDREKGLAFVRAVIRAINTYLDGDYQADDEVMAALAEETGTEVASLETTPALVFDWEIRDQTAELTQQFFIEFGVVEYDEPKPVDDVVDRSLYLEAVGAE